MKILNDLRVRAYAKINLYLDVIGKRNDGYHDLETVFHSIDLHDVVILRELSGTGISVSCNDPNVPTDSNNIAVRAAQAMYEMVGGFGGLQIQIDKRIPVAAGLAGGSANAAAVLSGINMLFDFNLSDQTLMKIGARLGADVPFCIQGGAAYGTGIGDDLKPLPPLKKVPLLLMNPGISISTADVFRNLHIPLTKEQKGSIIIMHCIKKCDVVGVAKNLYNYLELHVFDKHPEIAALKTQLSTQAGCVGALMSGTGATIYAIMHDILTAQESESHFKNFVSFCKITNTNSVGVCIDN